MSADNATDQGRRVFIEEAEELLGQLEDSLMELEDDPANQEIIGSVFRALHTIKGSGAMFGFDAISAFTHGVENVFDKVRDGEIAVTRDLIDTALKARDIIKEMLDSPDGATCDAAIRDQVTAAIDAFLTKGDTPAAITLDNAPDANGNDCQGPCLCSWRIRFRPPRNLFATGMDPVLLLDDLRELGKCEIVGMTEEIPRLAEMEPESLYIWWDVILTTDKGKNAIEDVFIFVADESEITIDLIQCHDEDGDEEDGREQVKKLGEILVERGEIKPEDLEAALKEQSRIGEILVAKGLISRTRLESALKEQKHVREVATEVRQKAAARTQTSSIRVASGKLDQLVNLVGELVTVQARLSQLAGGRGDNQLLFLAEEVERLSAELRDNTMSIRMLPIGATFNKFRRLVRDLSETLGKEIALEIRGAETELDKTVIEKLKDPLVHLIRNCVDHGIEPPEVRRQAGKPPEGKVLLAAEHSGAHVLIRIVDDGGGLDPERIFAKAVEKGIVSAEAGLSPQEINALIFAPGFSTAKEVSNVSGRGVGMDVVKNNIEALRGEIEIDSALGRGTTVTLKIPLTLAIIEGLLARIGDERYVLPLSAVEECVELNSERERLSDRRNLVEIRGELIPYVSLRERFDIPGQRPEIEQIVVTNVLGERVGLVVDEVIGQHQTVIKSLGKLYQNVREVSGATILGDGSVALILDVGQMLHAAEARERLEAEQGSER